MDIKNIVIKNRTFNEFKAEMDKKIEEERKKIDEVNNKFNIDDFMCLDYEEAKEIYTVLKHNLSYGEQRDRVYNALKELKKKKYPILLKAHYYPVINEIEYLTDNQKNQLDEVLVKFTHKEIMTSSKVWRDLKLSKEVTKDILEFLYDKGIVSKSFYINCNCGRGGDVMTETSYNDHKKYFDIEEKIKQGTETEEEYDWYENFDENERKWTVGCFDCEGRELLSMKDIDENSSIIYRNKTSPDMTYEDK